MKTKKLLNLGMMLACGLSIQAQTPIFHEGFDAEQSKQPTDVAYYEYINTIDGDERNLNTTDAFAGAGCLNFFNVEQNGNWWQRAVKFRNLPLQEGKSYRLTFRFKGSNTWMDIDNNAETKSKMSVALMQGGEDADIPLLDAQGNEFRYELSYFNPEQYEKYTRMFYFASAQLQKDTYAEKNPDKEPLADKWFATFNVYNPGDYYLDEVDLSESPIAAVNFAYEAIRVDFGYATNIKDLVKQNPLGRVIMPEGCASVKLNGADVPVAAVELQSDGYMYIFLDGVTFDNPETDKVEIAFKNPADESYQVKYAGTLAPEGAVPDFTDNTGEYLAEVENAISWAYSEPALVSTLPVDGSFALDETLDEVSFTFDKPVKTTTAYGDPLKVKLNGSEDLVLKTTDESGEGVTTLTFGRQDGKAFTKGNYSITLEGIASTKDIEAYKTFALNFETGTVNLAQTIYTDLFTHLLEGAANGQPTGWTIMFGGEKDLTGGTPKDDNGSGCRNMISTGSDGNSYTAFYLCDRDNAEGKITYMQYGDKEDARITLPAGNIEFSIMAIGHEAATRTLEFRLEDMNGNEVAYKSGTTSVQAENFTTIQAAGAITVKFNNPTEQNVILKIHEPEGGFTAARVLGFKARSYEMTEGDKVETEIVAQGDFASAGNDRIPAHGTGWKIYRNDGRMRDPGTLVSWGGGDGTDWTGGGGPRVKTLGNKNLNGAGIYLAGGCYATYGEYLVQTDHNGEVLTEGATTPEKTLNLKNARYQITYHIIGWKLPDNTYNVTLDIFKQEDGITGSPVYTRVDEVSGTADSGNSSADEAKKIQFLWNAPAEGKYILKFTSGGDGEGETVIGNITVESTASLAIQYAQLMEKALEPAKEELALANEKDEYKGATREELAQTIQDYTKPAFHTVAEYDAAFANIEALIKKSQTRRSNIDKYPTSLQALIEGLDAARGTKYENLELFVTLENTYNQYKDADYVAMNDEELGKAVSEMGNSGELLKNMVNTCVPLLTQQVADLAAAIVALDPNMETNEQVIAAGNALSDDQELVSKLKMRYAANLYNIIANGGDPFHTIYDGDLEEVETPIPASFLIQNPEFYTTAQVINGKTAAKVTDFPGWTIEQTKGQITSVFATTWGEKFATEVKPIENCAVKTGWGEHEYDVKQVIAQLPVFNYSASIKIGEDGGDPHGCYAYCGESQLVYEGETNDETGETKYTRDNNQAANLKEFTGVAPVYEEGATLGSITLGAHMTIYGGFGNVDNATLTITGILEGFDYAAAAQKLEEEITAVGNVQMPEGEPVSVSYYDLSGKKVSQPNGITIKVDTYKNGFMKVSKVLVK